MTSQAVLNLAAEQQRVRVVEAEARRKAEDEQAAEAFERAQFEVALESAPPKDRSLLDKERKRAADAKRDEARAQATAQAAREELVMARVDGRPANERRIDEADKQLARATRNREIAEDVVRRLEQRIVAAVREERGRRADADLTDVRKNWDASVTRLVDALGAIDELTGLHMAELRAAREKAASLGAVAFRWKADRTETERVVGAGLDHVATPEVSITVLVDGEAVSVDELRRRLELRNDRG